MEVLLVFEAKLREQNGTLLSGAICAVEQTARGPAVCFCAFRMGSPCKAVVVAYEGDAIAQVWQQQAVIHHRSLGGAVEGVRVTWNDG